MKRFHLHVGAQDLEESIRFYSTLFSTHPVVRQTDCANKYWITDPTGIAWETFHTLGGIPIYGEDTPAFNHGASLVPTDQEENETCCLPKKTESDACCETKVAGEPCCAA